MCRPIHWSQSTVMFGFSSKEEKTMATAHPDQKELDNEEAESAVKAFAAARDEFVKALNRLATKHEERHTAHDHRLAAELRESSRYWSSVLIGLKFIS
jgi:ribosome-associated translation inhibitor RaiA